MGSASTKRLRLIVKLFGKSENSTFWTASKINSLSIALIFRRFIKCQTFIFKGFPKRKSSAEKPCSRIFSLFWSLLSKFACRKMSRFPQIDYFQLQRPKTSSFSKPLLSIRNCCWWMKNMIGIDWQGWISNSSWHFLIISDYSYLSSWFFSRCSFLLVHPWFLLIREFNFFSCRKFRHRAWLKLKYYFHLLFGKFHFGQKALLLKNCQKSGKHTAG